MGFTVIFNILCLMTWCLRNILIYNTLSQKFSNYRMHQNHLEDLLKYMLLGPTPTISDSVNLMYFDNLEFKGVLWCCCCSCCWWSRTTCWERCSKACSWKRDPWASRIDITWEQVRNSEAQPFPQFYLIRICILTRWFNKVHSLDDLYAY